MAKDLSHIRKDYEKSNLNLSDLQLNPMAQFDAWMDEALRMEPKEANAFTLSTVGEDGMPSSRILLLKGIEETSFLFFTNYLSKKGEQLAKHDKASMLFWWPFLERQIRIEGRVEKAPEDLSDRYFLSRPRESQVGAICSKQSQVLPNREILDNCVQAFEGTPERPAQWGGYFLKPSFFEFWQGRPNRLHDRFRYQLTDQKWTIDRLYP